MDDEIREDNPGYVCVSRAFGATRRFTPLKIIHTITTTLSPLKKRQWLSISKRLLGRAALEMHTQLGESQDKPR